MIATPDKLSTAKQFSKAAGQYKQHAYVQKLAAELLFSRLNKRSQVMLDLGAGPLLHQHKLKHHSDCLVAMDLSLGMLSETHPENNVSRVCADMDNLPFSDNVLDTIFSNFAIQWSADPKTLFKSLHSASKPGSQVLISTVLDGSLSEIAQAWKVVDDKQHINDFLNLTELINIAQSEGFKVVYSNQHCLQDYYDKPINALKSVKNIGANHLTECQKERGLLGKTAYKNLLSAFPLQDGKAIISYQVGILELTK
ncbi:methyltransferase domain-containing protein [Pseudoalteromonas phenolica]|uniref:Methyltransferase domain protein n=1 Tax=Pseudoalteromonas phenolica TaxID=161398 RepID=A0A0S2K1W1_9GAMM|nr:methyltransferase domain-containing protein [Pseudoalteromonas phenolica]ALO42069.1 Methyltransferase domain protein [Pseudoalteromonas phenolica]MBE0353368.1 malonyl-CoA O-methyltransferase [Pseudoalteromonas phenolica O-BC30]RXF01805.1 methyltransferase domain-containing protein [Pseudoalteromonas phenolica O-BC30]